MVHNSFKNLAYLGILLINLSKGIFTSHLLNVSKIFLSFSYLRVSFKASGKGGIGFGVSIGKEEEEGEEEEGGRGEEEEREEKGEICVPVGEGSTGLLAVGAA